MSLIFFVILIVIVWKFGLLKGLGFAVKWAVYPIILGLIGYFTLGKLGLLIGAALGLVLAVKSSAHK